MIPDDPDIARNRPDPVPPHRGPFDLLAPGLRITRLDGDALLQLLPLVDPLDDDRPAPTLHHFPILPGTLDGLSPDVVLAFHTAALDGPTRWTLGLVRRPDEPVWIGTASFLAPPDPDSGDVEIAFSVARSRRREGIARAAIAALALDARAAGARALRARCRLDNAASRATLRSAGFRAVEPPPPSLFLGTLPLRGDPQ